MLLLAEKCLGVVVARPGPVRRGWAPCFMKPLSRQQLTPDGGDEAAKGQIRQANEALILAAAERVFAGAGIRCPTNAPKPQHPTPCPQALAAIAEAAGLPKANLHYYFGAKQDLYRAVLARTLQDWLVPTHDITPQADPGPYVAVAASFQVLGALDLYIVYFPNEIIEFLLECLGRSAVLSK